MVNATAPSAGAAAAVVGAGNAGSTAPGLSAKDLQLIQQAPALLVSAYNVEESWQKRITSIESLTRIAEFGLKQKVDLFQQEDLQLLPKCLITTMPSVVYQKNTRGQPEDASYRSFKKTVFLLISTVTELGPRLRELLPITDSLHKSILQAMLNVIRWDNHDLEVPECLEEALFTLTTLSRDYAIKHTVKGQLADIISLLRHPDPDVRKNAADLLASLAADLSIRRFIPQQAEFLASLLPFLQEEQPELVAAACQVLLPLATSAATRATFITAGLVGSLFGVLQTKDKTQACPLALQLLSMLARDVKGRRDIDAQDVVGAVQKLLSQECALAEVADFCMTLSQQSRFLQLFLDSSIPALTAKVVLKWSAKTSSSAPAVGPASPATAQVAGVITTASIIQLLRLLNVFVPAAIKPFGMTAKETEFADLILNACLDQWLLLLADWTRSIDIQIQLLQTMGTILLTTRGKARCKVTSTTSVTVALLQSLITNPNASAVAPSSSSATAAAAPPPGPGGATAATVAGGITDATDANGGWSLAASMEKNAALLSAILYAIASEGECATMRAELLHSSMLIALHSMLDAATMSPNHQKVASMAALALSRLFSDLNARQEYMNMNQPFGTLLKHIDACNEETQPLILPATVRNVALCLATLIGTFQHACQFEKASGFDILLSLRLIPHAQDYIDTLEGCLTRITQYHPTAAWRYTDRIDAHSLTVQTNGATAVVPMYWTPRLTVKDQEQLPHLNQLLSVPRLDAPDLPVVVLDPDSDSRLHDALAVAARIAAEHNWKCRNAKPRDDLAEFTKRQNSRRSVADDSVASLDDDKASIKSYKPGSKEEKATNRARRTDSVGSTASNHNTGSTPADRRGSVLVNAATAAATAAAAASASAAAAATSANQHHIAKFEVEEATGHMHVMPQVVQSLAIKAMLKTLAGFVAATFPLWSAQGDGSSLAAAGSSATTNQVGAQGINITAAIAPLFASGPTPAANASAAAKRKVTFENRLRELVAQHRSAVLPLGTLMNHGVGTMSLRALLFKACCDRIGFPCTVERNAYGQGWNTVTFIDLFPPSRQPTSSSTTGGGTPNAGTTSSSSSGTHHTHHHHHHSSKKGNSKSAVQPGRYLVKLKDDVGELIYEKNYMQWYQYTHV